MPYHIDEENSELAFEVREGNKLVIKIKSNIFSDSLELYLIKVGDNTEPTDKNVFSSLRVLKEIENLHDTILKEINSVTSGFWELKQDSQGNEYIATKYNVLTEGGLTTYGLGEQKLGTIYDGLPIDNDTIYWEEVEGSRVLKAKGSGGEAGSVQWGNISGKPTWIEDTKPTYNWYEIQGEKPFYTKEEVAAKFVTIDTEQDITALKHFTAGLSVGESKKKIYEENGVVYIDADVAVTGAMTFYATAGRTVSTIMDAVTVDGITIKKENNVLKAVSGAGNSFDENAMWSALSGSSENQINKSHLTTALDGYATQNWVIENYATKSELSVVSNKLNDFLEGSDTDEIINKWKELEAFLSGMAETDNLAEILETKADKKYVDSTFVTLGTKQTITGEKTFSSVLNTAAIKASGAITAPSLAVSDWVTIAGIKLRKLEDGALMLEGNLAVTGGITTYAIDPVSASTIMDGVVVDGITIKKENNVLKAVAGAGSSFDENAMWSALSGSSDNQINKSHLTTALDGYATQNWVIENYATKSELSAVSNKLSDFLEGSDTDNIINKWKELEAFLSGMAETDNLAEILETKADKKYVDSTFVTLSTKQTITGEKTFSSVLNTAAIKASGAITAPSLAVSDWVTIAGIKLRKLEDGALMLEGNLALTGALTMYASNGQSFDTIYDGLPIDNDTIYWQEVDGSRVLKARGGSGSSFDKSAMWTALAGSTTEQINKSHLTTALTGYATESWVSGKNYAVKATTLAGYGITDGVNDVSVTGTGNAVTDASVKGHILTLTKGSTFSLSGHKHAWADITSGKPTTLAGYGITDAYTKTESDSKYPTKTGSGASGTWGINVTGNAGTATKLQTTCNLWGHSFNGQQNISGDLTGVGKIKYNNGEYFDEYGNMHLPTSLEKNYWTIFNSNGAELIKVNGIGGIIGSAFRADNWYRSTGNTGWQNETYGGGWYMQDSSYIRSYNNKSIHIGSGSYITANGGYKVNNDANTSEVWNCRYIVESLSVPAGNVRNILGWYDSSSSGYTTSYIIGSKREIGNNWGELMLGVYQYEDAKRSVAVYMGLDGAGGRVYIGGNLLVTGGGTFYGSDIRYKSIMQQVNLSLLDIAKAPSFVYRWNKKGMKRDRLNLGGSAQYTQSILPWAVEEKENFLSMDYATVAYTFAVHTARHLLTYESRTDKKIKKLEREIVILKKQLKKLGYEEVRTLDDQSV